MVLSLDFEGHWHQTGSVKGPVSFSQASGSGSREDDTSRYFPSLKSVLQVALTLMDEYRKGVWPVKTYATFPHIFCSRTSGGSKPGEAKRGSAEKRHENGSSGDGDGDEFSLGLHNCDIFENGADLTGILVH